MEGFYVSCDLCWSGTLPTGGLALDVTAPEAISALGWQERDFGVICAACVEDEKARQHDEEEQGISSGCGVQAFAGMAASALGATDLESQQAARAFREPHPEGLQIVKNLFSPEAQKAYKDLKRKARRKKGKV